MALDTEFMKRIDTLAWNHPEVIPQEVVRNDRMQYRLYFRFMCLLYLMYRKGIMSDDELKTIKSEFTKDFERSDVLAKAAVKSARDSGRLGLIAAQCRKNTDCEYCRKVSEIYGGISQESDEDIIIEGG